ncbi:MAG: IS1634 family transposase [Syntrophorhabdus sp.]
MFIRKVFHTDKKNNIVYHTFKLIESVRTERGPRQRMLLNLGADFSVPEEKWKDLANRIEQIATGQTPLFSPPADIEELALLYAKRIISYHGKEETKEPSDYHTVDIDTMDHHDVRCVGAEHIIYETMKKLGLPDFLISLGFNRPALDCALGVIAAKLIAPSSERATHIWLQSESAMDDLLEADFKSLSQDRVYKAADMLLKNKTKIEGHLRVEESSLFDLTESIILYDLTNTFFEGSGRYNDKACFGNSKEKRRDCPLVTLALVLDADGFPKRTEVFPGNISEPGTLEEIISSLSLQTKPLVVVDAGIATEENIAWLKNHYDYIVVSRKKKIDALPDMVTVREDNRRCIRAGMIRTDGEATLVCHSTDKEIKETGIQNRFEKRFEEELTKVHNTLSKKHGTKNYDKVLEKIGRLKERYKRIARRYEITVTRDDSLATSVTWLKKQKEHHPGMYTLRSNRLDFTEQEFFDIFSMLTDIEDAFRSMKSELGLRPVYHQKEHRTDGHLFITVIAYHIMQTIRYSLKNKQINDSWSTIRKALSTHVRITTTIKRDDGRVIHIRKSTRPEPAHIKIYDALHLPHRPGKTIKTIL